MQMVDRREMSSGRPVIGHTSTRLGIHIERLWLIGVMHMLVRVVDCRLMVITMWMLLVMYRRRVMVSAHAHDQWCTKLSCHDRVVHASVIDAVGIAGHLSCHACWLSAEAVDAQVAITNALLSAWFRRIQHADQRSRIVDIGRSLFLNGLYNTPPPRRDDRMELVVNVAGLCMQPTLRVDMSACV